MLGVDLGLQRTGLALSDELGLTTRGLPNLIPRSRDEDVAWLVGVCRDHAVVDVAIGLALMAQTGDESPMSRRARGFARVLEDALRAAGLDVVVHLVDERGTSREAARRLVDSGVAKGRRRDLLDSEAARLLVEDVLARRR